MALLNTSRERNLDFDEVIDRQDTDSLKYDFAVRRGKPADVLPFWVADMDFRTSSFILDALEERTRHGIFGYTEPREDYNEALAGWMKKHHDLDISPEWVIKTPGVVFALAAAVRAFTEEGDSVLLQLPVYYPMMEVILDNKRKLVSNDLVLKNGHYEIDFEDLEKKIVDDHVKLFLLCSPHNPVGRVWKREELRRVVDLCLEHGVLLVSDEIHEDFVYPAHKHITLFNVDERAKDIGITCTSVSKTFNLAGLQISNILIPNPELRKRFRKQVDAAGYSQVNTFGVVAAKTAYQYGEEWHAAVTKYIHENLEFLKAYVEEHLPQIHVIEPEGTYLVWLDFRELGLNERELQNLIVNKAKLWLDDGYIFGKQGAGFQRINLATSRSILREALERIKNSITLLT
ncbi:MAG: pyridoxal phosphate-dependent aminotransferase [Lachnospiraceae bacterium]|nr:pyridoxal phosphate-dependent aminotransferase [Lachnospiraceae bacterium]